MGINLRLSVMPRKATRMKLLRSIGLIALFVTAVLTMFYLIIAFTVTIIDSLFNTI